MLKKLTLENFRNHQNFELGLESKTVIIGENGAGKSNIVEAISLLSFGRSYREEDKKYLVNQQSDYARVVSNDLEIFLQKSPSFLMKIKEKGVFKKQSEVVGRIRAVVFAPETVSLIVDSPKSRRKFLDILISQKDRNYLRSLIRYEKVRKEKNSLLKLIQEKRGQKEELEFWNEELVKSSEVIIQKREEAVGFLNQLLSSIYQKISGYSEDVLSINYLANAKDSLKEVLAQNKEREIYAGLSLFGPHRDDLEFTLNNLNIINFASRGELRSAILAIKLAEAKYLTEENENTPIILLDDIFSEFDQKRREHLLSAIENFQVLITTTDEKYLINDFFKEAKIVNL